LGRGTWEAQAAQAMAALFFKKDLLESNDMLISPRFYRSGR
jgi:hypothetical protein